MSQNYHMRTLPSTHLRCIGHAIFCDYLPWLYQADLARYINVPAAQQQAGFSAETTRRVFSGSRRTLEPSQPNQDAFVGLSRWVKTEQLAQRICYKWQ